MSRTNTLRSEKVAQKRMDKRAAILAVGAEHINRMGAGGIQLGDLAATLGLSRNALYYYVKDREDLVHQCYLHTCDQIEDILEASRRHSDDPQSQIRHFIETWLDPERAQVAILWDIDLLGPPHCEEVKQRCNEHVRALQDMIERGQTRGQFKQIDSRIAANTLLGMTNWTVLWVRNLADYREDLDTELERSAQAVSDIFFRGVSAANQPPYVCNLSSGELGRVQYNAFDRAHARRMRETQIIETASLLFNRRGIEGTTIEQIGESLGSNKSAIYRIFKDKTTLVDRCYERALQHYEDIWRMAETEHTDPAQVLYATFHLFCQAHASPRPPLSLQAGLPKKYASRANLLRRRATVFAKAAYENQTYRLADHSTSDVTAGAFFWIQKWRETQAETTIIGIANEMTNLLQFGLCAAAERD